MLISLKRDQVTILDRNTSQTYNVSYLIIQRYLIFSPIYHLGFNNGHGFIGYPEGRNVERALGLSCPCVLCISHSLGLYYMYGDTQNTGATRSQSELQKALNLPPSKIFKVCKPSSKCCKCWAF